MDHPSISVIVPIHNTESYLESCLDSVCAQTFEEIEIICVDDCSPDGSVGIVERYARRDDRIRLVRHERNLGLGGARNTGIRAARAPYIASVDSDDRMQPHMLERLWAATESGHADIVVCAFRRVDTQGREIAVQAQKSRWLVNNNNSLNIFRMTNPAFWNKLWRTSLYTQNDIYFPNFSFYQDLATTPRILSKARYIRIIDDCLYDYLVREGSITLSYSDKHIIDYMRVFDVLQGFLIENGLAERYEAEFRKVVRLTLKFHAQNVLAAAGDSGDKQAYLRRLAIVGRGYLSESRSLWPLSAEALARDLMRGTGKRPEGSQPLRDKRRWRVEDLSAVRDTLRRLLRKGLAV